MCHLSDLANIALAVHLTDAGHSSAVSNVNNIYIFVYYKKHQGTTASLVSNLPTLVECYLL